jgi:hypothetical protein
MPSGKYPRGSFSLAEFYTARVLKRDADACWGWSGERSKGRYGVARKQYAHRLSWEIHKGSIPDGMQVLHRCDNPPCTNPEHLYLGKDVDNRRDARDRSRYPGNAKSSRAKLTAEQVAEVKRLRSETYHALSREKASKAIADIFKVSPYTIRCILAGTRWAHVQPQT